MKYLGNMTMASIMYGGMKVNDPRCNGNACASGRANSRSAAAIVLDVASSSTVINITKIPPTTHNSNMMTFLREDI